MDQVYSEDLVDEAQEERASTAVLPTARYNTMSLAFSSEDSNAGDGVAAELRRTVRRARLLPDCVSAIYEPPFEGASSMRGSPPQRYLPLCIAASLVMVVSYNPAITGMLNSGSRDTTS